MTLRGMNGDVHRLPSDDERLPIGWPPVDASSSHSPNSTSSLERLWWAQHFPTTSVFCARWYRQWCDSIPRFWCGVRWWRSPISLRAWSWRIFPWWSIQLGTTVRRLRIGIWIFPSRFWIKQESGGWTHATCNISKSENLSEQQLKAFMLSIGRAFRSKHTVSSFMRTNVNNATYENWKNWRVGRREKKNERKSIHIQIGANRVRRRRRRAKGTEWEIERKHIKQAENDAMKNKWAFS